MINEGESGLTRLSHHPVYNISSCWETDCKKKTGLPCRAALTGVNSDRGGASLLLLWGLTGASGCGSALCKHTHTHWCQCVSCYGSFRSNGCGGSEPTEHSAAHPAGHPGFSVTDVGHRIGKTCRSGSENTPLCMLTMSTLRNSFQLTHRGSSRPNVILICRACNTLSTKDILILLVVDN